MHRLDWVSLAYGDWIYTSSCPHLENRDMYLEAVYPELPTQNLAYKKHLQT